MGSFKKLKSSDVITIPVIANKTWNFNYCPIPSTDPYISVYNGTNYTSSFNPSNEPITNTHYDRLTYKQINQLFYHQYSGSLNTASLASSIHYLSASSQHPSASFFNYNNDPAFISYFPTGANETIKVIQISPDAYGNKVLPYSFQMSSSNYNFYDDGKGNIYDNFSGPTPIFVGNIFYPEGTVVITSQAYQNAFVLPAVAYDDAYSIIRSNYPNPATFSFYPLANDDLRGNTLVNNSIKIFGGNASFFSTGSNNSVSLSFSGLGVGTYQTFYTFLTTGSYCAPLMSSTASIIINVTDPECEFEIGIVDSNPIPSLTPTISISATPSTTPVNTVSNTPSVTLTPTITPSVTLTPTITPSVTPTPTITLSVTPTISISTTPGVTLTPTATPSGTATPSISVTPTRTVTPTISITPTPTRTPTKTLTPTPTTSQPFINQCGVWLSAIQPAGTPTTFDNYIDGYLDFAATMFPGETINASSSNLIFTEYTTYPGFPVITYSVGSGVSFPGGGTVGTFGTDVIPQGTNGEPAYSLRFQGIISTDLPRTLVIDTTSIYDTYTPSGPGLEATTSKDDCP